MQGIRAGSSELNVAEGGVCLEVVKSCQEATHMRALLREAVLDGDRLRSDDLPMDEPLAGQCLEDAGQGARVEPVGFPESEEFVKPKRPFTEVRQDREFPR